MKEYICTALIRYSKQEVELHINALKIALQGENIQNYRGPYLALLKDMQRIKNDMLDKENDAVLDKPHNKKIIIEDTVTNDI